MSTLSDDPLNDSDLRRFRQHLPPDESLSDAETTQLWAAIWQQHSMAQPQRRMPVRARVGLGFRPVWAAAALVLVSVAGWFGWQTYANRLQTIQTAYGQNRQIDLPDGSVVTLNSNSTLAYRANWSGRTVREVTLTGEAYFAVTKQQHDQQPVKFVVRSGGVNIEVLGTRFNVRNRRGAVRVVLDEGRVQVRAGAGQPSVSMKPGEAVLFAGGRQVVRSQPVAHSEQASSWRQNVLIFNRQPLSEIAQVLADEHGLRVQFASDSLARLTFTGNLPANDPDLILQTLSKAFDLNIRMLDDKRVLVEAL